MRTVTGLLSGVLLAAAAVSNAQEHPRDAAIRDADTKAWWHTTEALSNDAMQGRDTGSEAYQRAAEYVAKRFAAADLKPAGDNGNWFQNVPLHQVEIDPKTAKISVSYGDRAAMPLRFLEDITAGVSDATPVDTTGELVFRGYCGKDAVSPDVSGKVVVCFGTKREGLPSGAERACYETRRGPSGRDGYRDCRAGRWRGGAHRPAWTRYPDGNIYTRRTRQARGNRTSDLKPL